MAKLHLCCFLLFLVVGFPNKTVSKSIVRYLPGLEGRLPFELETGYVSVDDSNGVELFYYFFKSENNPTVDPLIVWFAGGPGCSGLSAILFENGPFSIKMAEYNGSLPILELNPYSWTKLANIVFIDAPVGAGFAYSRSLQGSHSDDTISAKQGSIFIKKWLIDHPQYLSNPLYLGGDSYSGKTVPIIAQHVTDGIEPREKLLVNLKGYILGNPITDQSKENYVVPFAYGMALISSELFESAKKHCGSDYVNVDPNNVLCSEVLKAVSKCTEGLNVPNILEPKCVETVMKREEIVRDGRSLLEDKPTAVTSDRGSHGDIFRSPPPVPKLGCRTYGYMLSYYWANNNRVLKALNIRKGTVPEWLRCNQCGINYTQNVETSVGYHLNLSKRHYRSLIYNGDHDMDVSFLSTQAWIKSLNYSISDEWRPWLVDGQVAGYTRTYTNNMTFATVKGAGHIAIEYKPRECFAMVERWLSSEPL